MSDEIEMRWIDAWNDLYDLAATLAVPTYVLPDGDVVDMEAAKGWLQDAVYDGALVEVAVAWVRGVRRIALSRRTP